MDDYRTRDEIQRDLAREGAERVASSQRDQAAHQGKAILETLARIAACLERIEQLAQPPRFIVQPDVVIEVLDKAAADDEEASRG